MKKLLLLFLFLPLLTFGQNVQFGLKLVNQDTDAVVDETNPIQEGEVLRMELHMAAVGTADYDALENFKYLFLDIQYNHDLITPVDGCFDFPGVGIISDPGAITEKYDFSNTSFNSLDNHNLMQKYIDWKAGNISYAPGNAKWSVVRIAIQLSTKSFKDLLSPGDYTTATSIFDMCFDVKPGTAGDVEKEFRINLAGLEDTDAALPTSIYATKSEARYLYSIEEAVTYSTKLHFELPETLDPTNFRVNVAKGSMGDQEMPTTYTLDANADVIVNNVNLGDTYSLFTLEPIDGSYIPDVHTVTDAYRAFKFLTDVGINGGNYQYNGFEGFSADANLDGTLNSADTYGILAYVMGVDVNEGNEGGPGYCLPQQAEDGTWFHGCTATVRIEDYNEEVLGAAVALNGDGGTGGGWSSEFTPTENNQTFTFGYWHHVDLDQSHSTAYPATVDVNAMSAKTFNAPRINLSAKAVGTVNFDMVSRVEGGQVVVELKHTGESIVGMQARIKYDTNRLVLKDIVYDTGNSVTNFSKPLNKGLLFGALSVNGKSNIKEGTPFKLIFDTVGVVTNTTGLFYFENTDAVKANGDKMNLNIQ